MLELDVLVAMALGITADELCAIYRTQFPVLYGYDRNRDLYDASGRLVPNSVVAIWRERGDNAGIFSNGELEASHPGSGVAYEYLTPFVSLDREAEIRHAFDAFSG